MEKEIWKPVVGFEGLYECSSLGRVRSLHRTIKSINGSYRTYKSRILKPIKDGHGYLFVSLGRKHKFPIHRIIGKAFIPNPENLPCINHKDENPLNNRVDNIEWCDYSYNNSYGTRLIRLSNSLRNNPKVSSAILMISKNGEVLKEYKSIIEAKEDGFDETVISKCCRFLRKFITHKGFIWIYKKDFSKIYIALERLNSKKRDNSPIKIISKNIQNGEEKYFSSISEASKILRISVNQISKCCRGIFKQTNGYTFKYAE